MRKSEIAEIMRKCPGAKIVHKRKPRINIKVEKIVDNQSKQQIGRNVMFTKGEWVL